MTTITVNGYSAGWLKQGFPWVYPAEVVKGRARPGQIVALRSEQGEELGVGVFDEGWIAVRRFRESPGPLDAVLLGELLERARALRDIVVDAGTTAFRLVNAENDGLPGIRIDVYDWYAVVSLDSPSLEPLLEPICDWLEAQRSPRGIYLAWRPDARDKLSFPAPRLLRGHAPAADVRVTERGVAMLVRPGAGKDVGIFTDLRELRAWLEPFWGGRRVLNLFAHTGLFSVAAARCGATEVVSVDLSEAFLDRAEANFRANELDPGAHLFLAEDVRKALDRFRRTGESFGVAILDPPGFSHGPEGVMSAKKEYPRMVSSILRVMEPEGFLVGVLNLGEVSPRDFHGMVREGARKAGRTLQLVHEGGAAPDHNAAVDFPEGRYLKAAVWRVL